MIVTATLWKNTLFGGTYAVVLITDDILESGRILAGAIRPAASNRRELLPAGTAKPFKGR